MRSASSARPDVRPPLASHAALSSGGALRPTVRVRPLVKVKLEASDDIYLPTDPYVRRFWTAVLGPSAMVELLRLSKAARCDGEVREPIHLRGLLEAGLARVGDEGIVVIERVPAVPERLIARLPVRLRREHALVAKTRSGVSNGAGQSEPEGCDLSDDKSQTYSKTGRAATDKHGRQTDRQTTHPG